MRYKHHRTHKMWQDHLVHVASLNGNDFHLHTLGITCTLQQTSLSKEILLCMLCFLLTSLLLYLANVPGIVCLEIAGS